MAPRLAAAAYRVYIAELGLQVGKRKGANEPGRDLRPPKPESGGTHDAAAHCVRMNLGPPVGVQDKDFGKVVGIPVQTTSRGMPMASLLTLPSCLGSPRINQSQQLPHHRRVWPLAAGAASMQVEDDVLLLAP